MASPFRDFIPEGEDADGLGAGFTDFVPAKVEEKTPEQITYEHRVEAMARARAAKLAKAEESVEPTTEEGEEK